MANGGCEDECVNTDGSFYCDCTGGLILDSGGQNCTGRFYSEAMSLFLRAQ